MLPVAHGDNYFPLPAVKPSPASRDTNHRTFCFPRLLNVFYCSILSTVCQRFFEQMLFSPWVWLKGQGRHEATRGTTSLYPDQPCHEMKPSNPPFFLPVLSKWDAPHLLEMLLFLNCWPSSPPSLKFLSSQCVSGSSMKNRSACQGTCPLCPVDPGGWSQALGLL